MPKRRVIPFGKYAEVPITQVPNDYLRWVLENVDHEVAEWAEEELEERIEDPSHPMYDE